ncbi:stalk domain-containing protein [Paenibacillus humicola]|uniref:stalk domain-containing protein n=1 Tax=Paenibacillus humicola TaxID=3110540 RepID=UPI00237AE903|nr:stalk domain-containing protein [Paenibacillus humicola]
MKLVPKFTFIAIAVSGLLLSSPHASAADNVQLEIDGKTETDGTAYLSKGTTFVPLSMFKSLFDTPILPHPSGKRAEVQFARQLYTFHDGSAIVMNDSHSYKLQAAVSFENGQIMVPLRMIAMLTGSSVSWDSGKKRAVMKSSPQGKLALIAADASISVKLYETRGRKGLVLDVDGYRKMYDWSYTDETGTPPVLLTADLNHHDGGKEIVVILTTGRGTGLNIQQVHVVDVGSFKEVKVEDPLSYVSRNVQSQISETNQGVEISMTLQGKPVQLTKKNPGFNLNGKVGFGSIIYYHVDQGILKATLAGSISNTEFIGDFDLTYVYEHGQLKAGKLQFTADP